MDKPWWMWAFFILVVLVLLAFDLGVLHRKERVIGVKESLLLSLGYITIGLLFGGWVWYQLGSVKGNEYLTGYLIEKTLSMDNIFVISLIFTYIGIPRQYQHRVLFWGIMGVVILRGVMIGAGTAIVSQFHWVLYLFAAFLIFTGIKMLYATEKEENIAENKLIQFIRRHIRVTDTLHGNHFVVMLPKPKSPDKLCRFYTPLFLALVCIEFTDVIFAMDSIPAIFAITTDPYIVYTSNIFAILGLRALYFALDAVIHRFHYLKYALSLVLIFIGSKVFVADLFDIEKIPASVSLGVTIALLGGGVVFSMIKTRQK